MRDEGAADAAVEAELGGDAEEGAELRHDLAGLEVLVAAIAVVPSVGRWLVIERPPARVRRRSRKGRLEDAEIGVGVAAALADDARLIVGRAVLVAHQLEQAGEGGVAWGVDVGGGGADGDGTDHFLAAVVLEAGEQIVATGLAQIEFQGGLELGGET